MRLLRTIVMFCAVGCGVEVLVAAAKPAPLESISFFLMLGVCIVFLVATYGSGDK
jgi:hypothetical protein